MGTMTIESNVAGPTLRKAFEGHQVNNNALCPSSLYADMSVTVARYMFEKLKPGIELPAMRINKMEVSKPLIAGQGDDQRLLLHAEAHIDAGQVSLHFYSTTSEDLKRTGHAKCLVSYIDAQAALSNWKRHHYLIKPQVEALLHGVHDGTAEKMHRNTAYSLFGSFVKYGASYRDIEEVNVNLDECEATAKVAFQTTGEDGPRLGTSPVSWSMLRRLSATRHKCSSLMAGKQCASLDRYPEIKSIDLTSRCNLLATNSWRGTSSYSKKRRSLPSLRASNSRQSLVVCWTLFFHHLEVQCQKLKYHR